LWQWTLSVLRWTEHIVPELGTGEF